MQAVRSHRGPRPGRSQPFFPPLRAEELLGLERPQSWEGASQAPPPPPTAVSPVAGADPEAWILGGSLRPRLGVRVFGEEGFLPEPGQVSLARPRQGLGVGRVGAPSVSLVSQGAQALLSTDLSRAHGVG